MVDLTNATRLSTVRLMSAPTAKPSIVTRHKMHRILPLCQSFTGGKGQGLSLQFLTRSVSKPIFPRTAFRSTEVRPGRSSERRAEHFNKSAHTLITDRERHIGYRLMLRKPFKSGQQSRL